MADACSLEPRSIGLSQECRGLEFPDEDQQTSSPHFHARHDEEQTRKITFVPESTNILEDQSARENVDLSAACGSLILGSPDTGITIEARSDETHESMSRLSRIDSAKQDIKNLRSATLGRMGKIFKIRPPTPSEHKTGIDTEQGIDAASVEQQYGQDPTRKEKTHSLGRMLRLVDKDGAPRKLFSHTRTGSLTRLRKLQSTVGNASGGSEESRNIFTRMLNQFRGRNPSGTNAEPNLQSADGPSSPPKPSLGTRLMMSLSARGSPTAGTETETTADRVTVEYTA